MSYTQALSEFLADLTFEAIPEDVITQVKRLTIHTIGVSIAAAPLKQAQDAIGLAEQSGGLPEAHVWGGTGKKVAVENAAMANGTLADELDWEDCSWTGHPSAGAISAAFALAEALRLNGRDYITAVTAAYEGYQRIAMAVQPSAAYAAQVGWGLSSWQIFASALAAAKAYKLNAVQTNQTIGAALYQTPIPIGRHASGAIKSDIYHFAHGSNSQHGILAARLACIGFNNGLDYLDGPRGYWRYVSDQEDPSWYLRDLGQQWLIRETYIKHWPANMWIQTPLEILHHLYQAHPFSAAEVKSIRLSPRTDLTETAYEATGQTTLDAQFNAAFCLSAYILDPVPSAYWFTPDRLQHPEVKALAARFSAYGAKTTPYANFAVFKTGSFPEQTVEITMQDGSVLSRTEAYPKGHPRNNTTLAEEYDLFRQIAAPVIGLESAERFIEAVAHLETLTDINQAAEYLSRK